MRILHEPAKAIQTATQQQSEPRFGLAETNSPLGTTENLIFIPIKLKTLSIWIFFCIQLKNKIAALLLSHNCGLIFCESKVQ